MKNYIYIIAILCCITHMNYAQSESESLINKKVPDLTFGPIMNYTEQNTKLSDYAGKIVILDFWATWCVGCIKKFPHLEALKEKFSENIEILTVTSFDGEERIERFLSKKKTKLPIVLDTAFVLKKQFPHRVLSHTVIIGANRVIRAITTPENITEEVIQNILDGKEVNLKEKKDDFSQKEKDHLSPEDAIFQFTLTAFKGGSRTLEPFKKGRLVIKGRLLQTMYEYANGFPYHTRTIFELNNEEYKNHQYSLKIVAPDMTSSEVLPLMNYFLNSAVSVKARVEKRKIPVKVLQRTTEPLRLKKADPKSKKELSFSGEGVHMQNGPIDEQFMRFLEYLFAKPDKMTVLVNETGISGNYDIDIPWYHEDSENIHKELKKLGLKLVDAEREIDLLILYEERDTLRAN
ncbi:MAG: redoxin domain-containing protein [Cytophagales bacterium]|nr:redoxin domain-containing protein [Cytophagales bacterium]